MVDVANKNYYELLGVSRRASMDEIREAYKDIARIYHPDSTFYAEIVRVDLTEQDAEVFRVITNAYNVLSHPEKREKYDRTLPPSYEDDPDYVSDEEIQHYTNHKGGVTTPEWQEISPRGKEPHGKRAAATSGTFGTVPQSDRSYRATVTRSKNPSIHDMISERKRRVRNKTFVITAVVSVVFGSLLAALVVAVL